MKPQPASTPHWKERLLTLWEGSVDAVFICGGDGRLLLANPAFEALAGEGFAGSPKPSPHLTELLLKGNDEVLADGTARSFEVVMPSAAGLRFFWVRKGFSPGRPPAVYGIAHEITSLRAAERVIIDTSDREKERLGHQLRENFCQHLVGISLLGNVLFEELSKAGLEQARFAQEITRLVKEVVSEIRALEKGLSVAHLEQGEGLVEALRDLADLVHIQNRVECELHAPARKLNVPPETAMYIFRIAQDAVECALRRGPVQHLSIRIKSCRGAVELRVWDDGLDFPGDMSVEDWVRREFPIMHYRSRVIGASLAFKRLKTGCETVCRVPLTP